VPDVVGFALAAGVLTIIPGPDTLLTVRTAVASGRGHALAAGAGICTALLGWGCAAGLGLTAALAAAPGLYLTLRWIGAAYLAWMGLHAIIRGARWPAPPPGPEAGPPPRRRRWPSYLRGVLNCASNPKIGIFYLALFPQFIGHGEALLPASLVLAAIHTTESLVWLSLLACLGGRLGQVLRRRAARRWADRLSGAAFLAFAARLAAGG
jgi:threonine/homoserine/homoserine lactone efflux protein